MDNSPGTTPSMSDEPAVPAACPVAIQLGVSLVVASASCVVEIHLSGRQQIGHVKRNEAAIQEYRTRRRLASTQAAVTPLPDGS